MCLPQSSLVWPSNEEKTIYNLLQNAYFSTMFQNAQYNFLYTFILLSNQDFFYSHKCEAYLVTCLSCYEKTNLLLSSLGLCFMCNWINKLENRNCFRTKTFHNLVCLKRWNFPLSGMSHLHSWNPPWAPSNLPFPHCKLLLLTLSMHLIVFSSLSTFYWNLFQACDNSLHLGNNYIFCILLIYLYYLVLNKRHAGVSCPNISTFATPQYPAILKKVAFPCY